MQDWPAILSDPDQEKLAIMIHTGQRVTWPTIRMLQNRMKIEVRRLCTPTRQC